MRRAIGLLAGCALLAACSGGETGDDPATQNAATYAVPEAPTDAPAGNVTVPGGMRADVSGLTGSVSGLSTRITDMGTIIDLPSDALFDYDKATLTPAAQTQLRKAAELIRKSPAGAIQVIGHTDSHGDDAYNQKLSEARAEAVAGWFGGQVSVRQRQFQVSGKGEAAPIAPNENASGGDDPAGRAKNRRVEVIIPTA